ncbi:MAG: hypothetical protein FWE02_00800 [Defluviitaleaceae bacterium]|nr:hypothetical protein [Defluviitaleaceae bacterium]
MFLIGCDAKTYDYYEIAGIDYIFTIEDDFSSHYEIYNENKYDENMAYRKNQNYHLYASVYSPLHGEFRRVSPQSKYNVLLSDSYELLSIEDFPWLYKFHVPIIQIKNMDNKELKERINNNIVESITYWFNSDVFYNIISGITSVNTEVHLQNDRFLSFANQFSLYHPNHRRDVLYHFITIDMQTGQKIMLDDLVEVNDAFKEKILELEHNYLFINPSNLIEQLERASLNQLEILESPIDEFSSEIGTLMFRTSFTLTDNEIRVIFHRDGGLQPIELPQIVIPLEHIANLLLVPKW